MENLKEKKNKNRWIILLSVVIMTFMACLDSSIVNVALPVMARDLNVSMSSIQWVITSYLIVISCTILIGGRLGDIKGKNKVFKFGIICFTIGSFLCGISKSLVTLLAARVIQGIGAAGTMANSQGIITNSFPSNERGKALGISGTFVALGTMVGPPLGGFIVSFRWDFIFFINVPIGIIAFFMATKHIPKFEENNKEKLDLIGGILFLISVALMVISVTEGELIGYGDYKIVSSFIISILSFILFIILQKKEKSPLLDLTIFNNKLFSLSIFCGFISFVAISCSTIIIPFYLQDVINLTPRSTGLFMMLYPIVLSIIAPFSGSLSDRIGSEFPAFLGLLLTSIGLFLMAILNVSSPLWLIAVFTTIMGIGNGFFQSPNNSLIMSTVPNTKLGIAGSVNSLVRNLGMILGVTLSTTLLYNRMSAKIGYSVDNYIPGRNDVFIYGMRWVYIVSGSICLLGVLLSFIRLIKRKK